ncbi:MAG: hypothetical protein HOB26_10345 [Flavobacteriales bacterium]|jgi:hypothetical protein|nr:hypothetical protein [Flavobacteriales bacterium]MBT6746945.1 hypothetical protein [Flavobacteriales bacterium]
MTISKLNSLGVFGLSAIALICIAFSPFQSDWEEAKKKNGIIIYTKNITGYEIKMFKAITTYKNIKMSKVVNIIKYADKTEDWISDVSVGEMIKKTNEEQWLSYLLLDLPWPFEQREMALNHKITTNTPKEVYIEITINAEIPQKKEDAVKIENAEGSWKLIQEGTDVKVIYSFVADPNGNIPAWVINMFVVDGPIETLDKLHELCKVK